MTAPEAASPFDTRRHAPRLLARQPCRLSAAARADRAAARLFLRPAAGAVGIDAAGVDARVRRRSRHHRTVRAGRHALHAEIPVGAAGRCAACAVVHAGLRPPPRLAGVLAIAADRRDPAAGVDRPGALAVVRRARRAAGRRDVLDAGHRGRCLPRREPARKRAGRRHGVLCRGLSHRHAGLDRGRAVHRQRLRKHRHRADVGLDVGLCRDGGAGADRHRHGARRDRARTIGARGSRDADGDGIRARAPCGGRRVLRIPDPAQRVGGARLRGAVQIHRRVFRHHDRAVRDRSRLFAATTTPRSSRASASPPP